MTRVRHIVTEKAGSWTCNVCGPTTVKVRHGYTRCATVVDAERQREHQSKKDRGIDYAAAHRLRRARKLAEVAEALGRPFEGSCDLCGEEIIEPKLDHDHETGKWRGYLCNGCNTALGRLGDNEAGLQRALAYVTAVR